MLPIKSSISILDSMLERVLKSSFLGLILSSLLDILNFLSSTLKSFKHSFINFYMA
jgi:hypothetical protein